MPKNTEFKNQIATQIMNNRPRLSESSLSSYVSTLANIHTKIDEAEPTIDWIEHNTDAILEFYKDTPVNKRKSILSAIQVLTNKKNPKIETQMMSDIKEYNIQNQEQKKSKVESDNWIKWKDVMQTYNDLEKIASPLLKNKNKLFTPTELELLNQYILLSFFIYIPPRRSLDYAVMKLKNYELEDNYITKNGQIVFNIYKTSKHYGEQKFQLTGQLKSILTKWRKINITDYLLINPIKPNENKPFNSVQINRMFNQIFGKKISVDILRHSYITKFYSGLTPSQSDINDLSFKMAHSATQNMLYRRV